MRVRSTRPASVLRLRSTGWQQPSSVGGKPTAATKPWPSRSTCLASTARSLPPTSTSPPPVPRRWRRPTARSRAGSTWPSKPSAAYWSRMTVDQTRNTGGRGMSQVTVTINGRQFRMACEDGQEGHLKRLAEDIDRRIDGLRSRFGEIGDTRLTVMAALTVADELSDVTGRLTKIEQELASLQDARVASADHAKAT